ncbi:hypothetical protein PVAND_004725 [Polypedilum vanderplanki]|uniref:Uncharacterized protein n=1 Tax=Polypedilum vanderplanki TaxID=319348 RepID=A0A9J6BY31_POLVA|nr:hypothetical protein PVAND_004725 [Polypedilum vanderplanki]
MSDISNKEVEAPLNSSAMSMSSNITAPNELKKSVKIQELPNTVLNNHVTPAGISRERSFVRTMTPLNHQNLNKRRSMGFQQQQQTIRMKPAMEIYRPPSK